MASKNNHRIWPLASFLKNENIYRLYIFINNWTYVITWGTNEEVLFRLSLIKQTNFLDFFLCYKCIQTDLFSVARYPSCNSDANPVKICQYNSLLRSVQNHYIWVLNKLCSNWSKQCFVTRWMVYTLEGGGWDKSRNSQVYCILVYWYWCLTCVPLWEGECVSACLRVCVCVWFSVFFFCFCLSVRAIDGSESRRSALRLQAARFRAADGSLKRQAALSSGGWPLQSGRWSFERRTALSNGRWSSQSGRWSSSRTMACLALRCADRLLGSLVW